MIEKAKRAIYWRLTLIRDKRYVPGFITEGIDWLRYEVFYPYSD